MAALAALAVLALPAAAGAETHLLAIDTARADDGGVRLTLRTDAAPPDADPFALEAPSRLVLDLPGVVNATGEERFDIGSSHVTRVRLGQHPDFLRVVLDLGAGAPEGPRIERSAEGLALAFGSDPVRVATGRPGAGIPPASLAVDGAPVPIHGSEPPAGSERGRVRVAVERPLPDGARDDGLALSFVDTDLPEIVREVGKATDTGFRFDERLSGRVTLSVVHRVTRSEALEMLHSALLSQGFAAVPWPGGGFRILPADDGRSGAPQREGPLNGERAVPLTTLLPLHGAAAPGLVATLQRMAGSEILASAFVPTNSLILSGSEAAVRRYLAVAQALDAAEDEELARLAQADVQRVARDVAEETDRRPPAIAVNLHVIEIATGGSLALGLDSLLPFGEAANGDRAGAFSIESGAGDVFEPLTDPGAGFLRFARTPLLIPILGPDGVPTELVAPRETVQITDGADTLAARTLLHAHLIVRSGEQRELEGANATADPAVLLRVRPTAEPAGKVRLELEVEAPRVRPVERRRLSAAAQLHPGQLAVLGMSLDEAEVKRERAMRSLVIAVQADVERTLEERIADGVHHRLALERTLARRRELGNGAREGYALLVTTRASEAEARGVASALAGAGRAQPRVVAWQREGEPCFDVYLDGFESIRSAAAAAHPLLADGWEPELVALPPQAPARQAVRVEE